MNAAEGDERRFGGARGLRSGSSVVGAFVDAGNGEVEEEGEEEEEERNRIVSYASSFLPLSANVSIYVGTGYESITTSLVGGDLQWLNLSEHHH